MSNEFQNFIAELEKLVAAFKAPVVDAEKTVADATQTVADVAAVKSDVTAIPVVAASVVNGAVTSAQIAQSAIASAQAAPAYQAAIDTINKVFPAGTTLGNTAPEAFVPLSEFKGTPITNVINKVDTSDLYEKFDELVAKFEAHVVDTKKLVQSEIAEATKPGSIAAFLKKL